MLLRTPYIFYRQVKGSLKSNDLTILGLTLISTWLLAIFYYKHDLKFIYYVDTDAQFMDRLDSHFKSSLQAKRDMLDWLRSSEFVKKTPLFYPEIETRLPKLCVAVMTKPRNAGLNRDYVSQTLVSLLARTKLAYMDEVRIVLYDAGADEEFRLKNLTGLVHVEGVKQPNSVNFSVQQYEHMPKVKEAVDYISVMQSLYKYPDCQYGLVFEDDVIAAPSWYEKLATSLRELDDQRPGKWLCLKLFTAFRYYDWITHIPTLVRSVIFVLASLVIQTLLFRILQTCITEKKRQISLTNLRQASLFNPYVVFILGLNLTILTVFLNSSSIRPIGYGLKAYTQGFNAVAIVYPREQLWAFSNHLADSVYSYVVKAESEFVPKDIVLDLYRKVNNLDIYAIEPSLVQHVGVHSSLRDLRKSPANVKDNQYRPFQSYSYMKNYGEPVRFDPFYWNENKKTTSRSEHAIT